MREMPFLPSLFAYVVLRPRERLRNVMEWPVRTVGIVAYSIHTESPHSHAERRIDEPYGVW